MGTTDAQSIINTYTSSLFLQSPVSRSFHCGLWGKDTKNVAEAHVNTNRVVAEALALKKGQKVLDAGCGVGGTSVYFAENYDVNMVGITIVPAQIKTAEKYRQESPAKAHVTFLQRSYFETGFKANTFDHVFGLESMCYAWPLHKLIQEMYRILKPGGKMVSLDAFLNREPETEEDKRNWEILCQGFTLKSLHTVSEFTKEMKKQGFKKVKYIDKTDQLRPSLPYYFQKATQALPLLQFLHFLHILPQEPVDYVRAVSVTKYLIEHELVIYGLVIGEK